MRRHLVALIVAVLAATIAPSGASAATRIYVKIGPPAAVVEVRPVAPGPRHVWIAGYHRWDGHVYVWVPGRWEQPPAHYTAWAPGHWSHHHSNGWYWVDGHWKR